jgi:hypothetical protein
MCYSITSKDDAAGTITNYGLYGQELVPSTDREPLLLNNFPDQLWDPLSFLCNGKMGLFPQEAKQPEYGSAHTFLCSAKV